MLNAVCRSLTRLVRPDRWGAGTLAIASTLVGVAVVAAWSPQTARRPAGRSGAAPVQAAPEQAAPRQASPGDPAVERPLLTRGRSSVRQAAHWADLSSPGLQRGAESGVRPCQKLAPVACCPRTGVMCDNCGCGACGHAGPTWDEAGPLPWQVFAQGEYIGPARIAHVPEYRLRVDDTLEFIYRQTRNATSKPYKFNVGDVLRIESFTDNNLDRQVTIQTDGTIPLRLLGQVRATGRTVEELRAHLEKSYKKFFKVRPEITVTPVEINTKMRDLLASVDRRAGEGGLTRRARITPEGTIQLPVIGSAPAQGLTLDELKREIDERYRGEIEGLEVTPVLVARAPRFVYVLGEVRQPGRIELTGPTTVMQSIAMAGGWNVGGDLRQIVIFRRDEAWRLMATRLDLRASLWGKEPCPADEIWLRDSDIVLVPKSPILRWNDFIELIFTRGLYGIVPVSGVSVNFSKLSSI